MLSMKLIDSYFFLKINSINYKELKFRQFLEIDVTFYYK